MSSPAGSDDLMIRSRSMHSRLGGWARTRAGGVDMMDGSGKAASNQGRGGAGKATAVECMSGW